MENMTQNFDVEQFLNEHELYVRAWQVDKDIFNKFDKDIIIEIIKNNYSFINEHGLTVSDVQMYIDIQNRFNARTQSTKKPNPADVLEVWSNNNKIFYQNAHIEKCSYNDTGWTWCEHASSHYIDIDCFSTSGGAWHDLNIKDIKYVGTAFKTIWTWGHTGARGNGGMYIKVKVNKFKLVLDRKYIALVVSRIFNSDYKYMVKNWDKASPCFYSTQSCFKTMSELKQYLKQRHLKIGKKLLCNNFYHEIIGDFDMVQHMSKKEYDDIRGNIKEFALMSNGELTGAFYKNKQVHFCNPNVKDRKIFK